MERDEFSNWWYKVSSFNSSKRHEEWLAVLAQIGIGKDETIDDLSEERFEAFSSAAYLFFD